MDSNLWAFRSDMNNAIRPWLWSRLVLELSEVIRHAAFAAVENKDAAVENKDQ